MAGGDRRETLVATDRPAARRRRRLLSHVPGGPWQGFGFAIDRLWLAMGASLERELDAARGLPWLAVAFGAGALAYFALPSEPVAPALLLLAIGLAVAAWRVHERAGLFRLLLLASLFASGVAATKLRTDALATPILEREVTATVTGWVEGREGRRGGYRLTLRVASITGAKLRHPPTRVTVTVRGDAARVGDAVSMLARLRPPSGPALPGGYDFARNAYYEGIGATGFAYGPSKPVDLGPVPLSIRLREPLEIVREAIRVRVLAALSGDTGRIASSLIIGDPGGISDRAEDDLRQSGLAHVLSVSGLHMVLVAGAAFWMIRALLALVPTLALRHPIKKWAAAGAIAVTFFYLLISGLDVAAQRSFIMTVIVFSAILVDRRAISMRNVAIATFIVLALAPESILGAGFQMSFAATVALVAGFEAMARYRRGRRGPPAERSLVRSVLGWAAALVAGLAVTSLLGGLGTTPFALYHFQRMAPLSIVANVLAMPLVDFLVMPMALIAVLLMPFGLDQPFLAVMGFGIDGMMVVASHVAAWSEGSGGAAMPSAAALLIFIAGFLWLALMGERWRLAGIGPMLLGGLLAFLPARPDMIIAANGLSVAYRGADGGYEILARKIDKFGAGIWLRADGDPRDPADPALKAGTACDSIGCVGRLPDGRIVALALDRAAFADDCRMAALIVTPLTAPAACDGMTAVVDRSRLARTGAVTLVAREVPLQTPTSLPRPRGAGMATDSDEFSPGDEADATGIEAEEDAQASGSDEPATPTPPVAREADKPPEGTDRLDALFVVGTTYPAVRRAWMPPLD
ncbi:competence protein ComEC [Kaistia soli DSM 19436]|uniref:Competence protein ComEC n=1 Tax=Kaistia soli DSM 19436 TaxID=1122133 RepID=A0A1M5GIE5_9HYPH|nr:ComEC/Rec2 family competence protein [Kaistia soli]SHG03292.1 competence protein ComEC [Kaistia soli DSM 19436]